MSVRQFRIAINLAESFSQSAFASETEAETQLILFNTVLDVNRFTFVPYTNCRLVPSIDRIQIWDSRFSQNRFAGHEYSFSAVHEFNHSLTISTLGLSTWDVSVAIFSNGALAHAGQAQLGSVCNDNTKGKVAVNLNGAEHLGTVLTHELGHAFGAQHTYDAISGLCSDFRDGGSAVEIGSGATVMSYAGRSEAYDNYETQPYPRFHARSTQDILAYLATVSEPMTPITNVNFTPPTVTATSPRTIPRETPFVLDVTDATSEFEATITWEQMNYATADPPVPPAPDTRSTRTLFRCYEPTFGGSRMIPRREDLFAGVHPFEILPTNDRTLNFRCTITTDPPYDQNNPGLFFPSRGTADVTVNVEGEPFRVTSPEEGEYVRKNCPYSVTWDVGGGDFAENVEISWTVDEGQTYTTLVASTENDGLEEVMIPNVDTADARIKVRAIGEIFFSINPGKFRTTPKPDGEFIVAPLAAPGGQDRWARVILDEPADQPVVYNVSSSDSAVAVPSQLVIGTGELGQGFTMSSSTVSAPTNAEIRLRRPGQSVDAHSLQVTVLPASPPTQVVTGSIDLGGYERPILVPATVTVVRGTASQAVETYLGPNGEFRVVLNPALSEGRADVFVKPWHWLRKRTADVDLLASGANIGAITCLDGDVDGDNEVDIVDFGLLSQAYDSTPQDCHWTWAADLNGDLSVDIGDFAILSETFGGSGD